MAKEFTITFKVKEVNQDGKLGYLIDISEPEQLPGLALYFLAMTMAAKAEIRDPGLIPYTRLFVLGAQYFIDTLIAEPDKFKPENKRAI